MCSCVCRKKVYKDRHIALLMIISGIMTLQKLALLTPYNLNIWIFIAVSMYYFYKKKHKKGISSKEKPQLALQIRKLHEKRI